MGEIGVSYPTPISLILIGSGCDRIVDYRTCPGRWQRMIRSRNSLRAGLLTLALLSGIPDARGVAAEGEPGLAAATRPDPEGQATRVSLGVFFVDISEIEDAKQTFKVEIYVMIRWKDPRLASAVALRRMPLANVWQPAL